MNIRHMTAACTLLMLAATRQQASAQIVQNGSFELPVLTDPCACHNYRYNPVDPGGYWMYVGNSGIVAGTGTDFNAPSPFPDGNQVAFLQHGGPSDTRIFQDVTLASGGRYRLSYFDAGRNNQTFTGNTIYDIFLGSLYIGSGITSTGQAFGSHSIEFDAPAGTQSLTFLFDANTPAGDNTVFFDQVQIEAVTSTPEPTSVTLLATGLVGVLGAARRKRKAGAA